MLPDHARFCRRMPRPSHTTSDLTSTCPLALAACSTITSTSSSGESQKHTARCPCLPNWLLRLLLRCHRRHRRLPPRHRRYRAHRRHLPIQHRLHRPSRKSRAAPLRRSSGRCTRGCYTTQWTLSDRPGAQGAKPCRDEHSRPVPRHELLVLYVRCLSIQPGVLLPQSSMGHAMTCALQIPMLWQLCSLLAMSGGGFPLRSNKR